MLLWLACQVLFFQAQGWLVEMEKSLQSARADWSISNRSPAYHKIDLLFAVKQTHLDELEATLMSVSDPDSPSYGQHLSNEEVHALIAPLPESILAVEEFLREAGIDSVSLTPNSDFIRAEVTVPQAEELLQAEYFEMVHKETGQVVHRTLVYSLPARVADAVDFVSPTVHIPAPSKSLLRKAKERRASMEADVRALVNSPQVLRDLYSVDVEGTFEGSNMAVTAFLEQYISLKDLHAFWNMFCQNITCGKGDPKLVGDASADHNFGSGVESMLDIQTITGVAGNIHSEFWGFSGRSPDNNENEPFLAWLTQVSSTSDADVPKIFSSSYGEDEDSWSLDAATRLNTEYQKAGTRGISLLFASGDEGANCKSKRFVPETPGSSPWVTAVGGTYLGGTSAVGLSSGGFSDRWAQPSWQAEAVHGYLSSGAALPSLSAGYNVSGRAYPDISAQATDFTVVVDRIPMPGVAGTSAACPTASGVIALLNDARQAAGQPVLGFLNPWIYKNMAKWNDITKGSGSGAYGCGGVGWPAVSGWDAVTGVGTPNYKNLVLT